MPLSLTLNETKAIIKTVCKERKVKVRSGNLFVEQATAIGSGKLRYYFFVAKGSIGKGPWLASMAVNWLSNVIQGAVGAGTSGLGAVGSGVATVGGKASGLASLGGAFRDGVLRDARDLEGAAGAGNLLHVMKAQNALYYCGCIDTFEASSWGMWGALPSDSGQYSYYLRYVRDRGEDGFRYHFKGEYHRAEKSLTIGDKPVKLQKV